MLTTNEIGLLMEGLDALKLGIAKDGLLHGMLSIVFAPEGEKEKAAKEARKQIEQKDAAQQMLEERIILLKAKLIGLKTTAAIDSVFMEQPK